jgi:hypothetical protein
MKFDRATLATMLAVSAAALAGCDQKQCVDAKGKVVSNTYCGGSGGGGGVGSGHPGFFFVPVGRMGGGFGAGSGAAVSRGGFGGEAGGYGGAAGE